MAVRTSNHVVVQGDAPRKIEVEDGKVVSEFTKEFDLGGAKDSGASAIVFLMVKGLVGDAEGVDVAINGKRVGELTPNPNSSESAWFTQMLHYSKSEGALNPNEKNDSTVNTIQIPADGTTPKCGKFYVMNVVILHDAIID